MFAVSGTPGQGSQPELAYRLMVWVMAVQDALGLGALKRNLSLIRATRGMRVVDWGFRNRLG
jgi:hypothetical protein